MIGEQLSNRPIIPDGEKLNVSLINPAWLPEWFWLPVGKTIESAGHEYFIPRLPRGDINSSVEDSVDCIDDCMKDTENQMLVTLSRGIEYGIRYLDRLSKRQELGRVLGWMIISSVGPKGYDIKSEETGLALPRHTPAHNNGVKIDEQGFEIINSVVADSVMLHDLEDKDLKDSVLSVLVKETPFSPRDISSVPLLEKHAVPTSWYIGQNDLVDNTERSLIVAKDIFGVEAKFTDWGHVGPLTHVSEVAAAILEEAEVARNYLESKFNVC